MALVFFLLVGAARAILVIAANLYYALVLLPVTLVYGWLATAAKKLE